MGRLQTGCLICSGKVEIPETPPAAGVEQTNQHTVCSLLALQSPPGFNHPAGVNVTFLSFLIEHQNSEKMYAYFS